MTTSLSFVDNAIVLSILALVVGGFATMGTGIVMSAWTAHNGILDVEKYLQGKYPEYSHLTVQEIWEVLKHKDIDLYVEEEKAADNLRRATTEILHQWLIVLIVGFLATIIGLVIIAYLHD